MESDVLFKGDIYSKQIVSTYIFTVRKIKFQRRIGDLNNAFKDSSSPVFFVSSFILSFSSYTIKPRYIAETMDCWAGPWYHYSIQELEEY